MPTKNRTRTAPVTNPIAAAAIQPTNLSISMPAPATPQVGVSLPVDP